MKPLPQIEVRSYFQTMPASVFEGARGVDAAAEIRAMVRAAPDSKGVQRILDRISLKLNCHAVLVEPGDAVAHDATPRELFGDIHAVSTGLAAAVARSLEGRPVCLLPVGVGRSVAVLVVVGNEVGTFTPEQRSLLADATVPLLLARQMRETRMREARVNRAEDRNREAVLQLLVVGATAAARRAADALGPRLPDLVRVHLIECAGRRVTEMVHWCAEKAVGAAWVVRCPVYRRHVVVLARSDADEFVGALKALAANDKSYHVGSSPEMAITEFATAYRHAFHGLSVARHRPGRYAAFRERGELSEILSGIGERWARRTLAPLLAYAPSRPQDPDSEELFFTLTSWLNFHNGAIRYLRIHRNTLSSRLRRIASLLGVDLSDVATQARLNLATQLFSTPGTGPDLTLDDLLNRPEVQHWAQTLLRPLHGSDPRLTETLRAWLDNGAQIGATATALGVSASGVRKRLLRVEDLVERSVLGSPSARYDLSLALELETRVPRASRTAPATDIVSCDVQMHHVSWPTRHDPADHPVGDTRGVQVTAPVEPESHQPPTHRRDTDPNAV